MPELLPEAQPEAPRPHLIATSTGVSVHGTELAWSEVRHVAVVDLRAAPVPRRRWFRRSTPPAAPVRLEFVVADVASVRDRFASVSGVEVRMSRRAGTVDRSPQRGMLAVAVDAELDDRELVRLLRRVFVEAEVHAVPQGWFEASADAERAAQAYLSD